MISVKIKCIKVFYYIWCFRLFLSHVMDHPKNIMYHFVIQPFHRNPVFLQTNDTIKMNI